MSKILVVNGPNYGRAVEGLGEIVTDPEELITNPGDIKLVLFTGGEDVTPAYYGHTSPNHYCMYNESRDQEEFEIFQLSQAIGIRSIGICRGSQFINVMAGGTMIHHMDNHAGPWHNMETLNGEIIRVTSTHHQMSVVPDDSFLIGWSKENLATRYYGDGDEKIGPPEKETEAALFPNIESAGVQYHPEVMSKETEGWKWFFNLAKDLIEIDKFYDVVEKYGGQVCMRQDTYQ